MKWSQTLIPTLREAPSDAEIVSHKLLLRAGLIRKLAAAFIRFSRSTRDLVLREAPSDAEIVSHKLLLRAGLIRKLAGGVYTFLPLGLRVLRKVENIIREEMNRSGGIEVLMPALQPPEIWEASGRAETASNVLFKVKDSSGRQWFLSPTAEEVITSLTANELNSYRSFPRTFTRSA